MARVRLARLIREFPDLQPPGQIDDDVDSRRPFGDLLVEVERLALSRCFFDVRLHSVARVSRPLQEIVALGQAQIHQLAVVAVRRRAQRLERGPRLRVALRAEEPLGATELEPVAVRSTRDRPKRQGVELGAGGERRIAERKFVEHA